MTFVRSFAQLRSLVFSILLVDVPNGSAVLSRIFPSMPLSRRCFRYFSPSFGDDRFRQFDHCHYRHVAHGDRFNQRSNGRVERHALRQMLFEFCSRNSQLRSLLFSISVALHLHHGDPSIDRFFSPLQSIASMF